MESWADASDYNAARRSPAIPSTYLSANFAGNSIRASIRPWVEPIFGHARFEVARSLVPGTRRTRLFTGLLQLNQQRRIVLRCAASTNRTARGKRERRSEISMRAKFTELRRERRASNWPHEECELPVKILIARKYVRTYVGTSPPRRYDYRDNGTRKRPDDVAGCLINRTSTSDAQMNFV